LCLRLLSLGAGRALEKSLGVDAKRRGILPTLHFLSAEAHFRLGFLAEARTACQRVAAAPKAERHGPGKFVEFALPLLKTALGLLHGGCSLALAEKAAWGGHPSQARSRWVTCGLIDAAHAAVARHQGAPPWEADGSRADDPLQPQLGAAFEAIEAFLDIDLPAPWNPPDKAAAIRHAADGDGEWDVEPPLPQRDPAADTPSVWSKEMMLANLLESTVRR